MGEWGTRTEIGSAAAHMFVLVRFVVSGASGLVQQQAAARRKLGIDRGELIAHAKLCENWLIIL